MEHEESCRSNSTASQHDANLQANEVDNCHSAHDIDSLPYAVCPEHVDMSSASVVHLAGDGHQRSLCCSEQLFSGDRLLHWVHLQRQNLSRSACSSGKPDRSQTAISQLTPRRG